MRKAWLIRFMSFWPPYLGAGIRVTRVAQDLTSIDVEIGLRFWNQNYVGTHFGGSLYSMVDPFLMLMLIENLGNDYIVWDKSASIRFKKPGRGRVRAHFHLTREHIESIRAEADRAGKLEPVFQVSAVDDSGAVIAEVEKTLYIRRKDRAIESTSG